jgi:hypothetical protein
MTDTNQLMRANIMEYESRIKRFDELIVRADKAVGKGPEHAEVRDNLASLKQQRDKFAGVLDELRLKSLENWRVDESRKPDPWVYGMPLPSNWRNWSSVLNAK